MNGQGTFGVGAVGRFARTLPPRTKVEYDPGYELMLEVRRWFHYRHDLKHKIIGETIIDTAHLEAVMIEGYRRLFRSKMKYWPTLEEQARVYIQEFKDTFRDVLAEMEFTR